MQHFISKHCNKISGTLSSFDRVLFKGHLPIAWGKSMEKFMSGQGRLIKEFKTFVEKHSTRLVEHAKTIAEKENRPYIFLRTNVRKEQKAREIAEKDRIKNGLICIFSAVEGCQSFKLAYGKGRPNIKNAPRKCLCLYFYFIDKTFGFMHIRIQTWFPFTIQVCVNGHEWLAGQLDKRNISYTRPVYGKKAMMSDNTFLHVADFKRAQRIADKFPRLKWPAILHRFARSVNPLLKDLLSPMEYYWVAEQSEFATDIIFKDHSRLESLYEKLLKHATLFFSCEDIMTFLGKKLHGGFAGDIINTTRRRWPGARVKHRVKGNWIKMYNKAGNVLRVETVINSPSEFKVRRRGICKGREAIGWFPMPKGVAHLRRHAGICTSANGRYLDSLAAVEDPAIAIQELHRLAEPVRQNDRPFRGFNPASGEDVRTLAAIMRGEHTLNGFRNKDVRCHLFSHTSDERESRRQSAAVSRVFKRLHVRKFIAKIPRSRRWRVTRKGVAVMTAVLKLYHEDYPDSIVAVYASA